MNTNSRPMKPEPVRNIWTQREEAQLIELQQRRDRIMEECAQPLRVLIAQMPVNNNAGSGGVNSTACGGVTTNTPASEVVWVRWLTANATELRAALEPFDASAQR